MNMWDIYIYPTYSLMETVDMHDASLFTIAVTILLADLSKL